MKKYKKKKKNKRAYILKKNHKNPLFYRYIFCYRFLIILPISELGKLNAFFCKMQMTPLRNIHQTIKVPTR